MKKTLNILLILTTILALSNITNAQERTMEFIKKDKILFSCPANEIDYLIVESKLSMPKNIKGSVDGNKINIKWDVVKGANSYDIYRSSDDKNYTKIGTATTNSYTDRSPKKGANYYKIKAIGKDNLNSDLSNLSALVGYGTGGESGIYLGITGFNESLYEYPISHLTEDSQSGYNSFIDGLTIKYGTILYYSVDEALYTLQEGTYPVDLFNVSLVTFTDGLDQGSFMMNSNYGTDEKYLDAINYRIKNEKVSGYPINAYSIGIRSGDVTDIDKFKLNLKKLASKDENAMEVTSMSEVNKKFQEIAQQLVETNAIHNISLNIPGLANGTRVRFTFDNVSSGKNSNLYIEGVFSLPDKTLTDITYKGFEMYPGSSIKGSQDGIFVTFSFEGMQTESRKTISKDYIKEWTYVTSTSSWQPNIEFDKTPEAATVETKYRSAVVMLVLDCSSSLGSDFASVQMHAKNFINVLLKGKSEGGNTDPGTIDPGTDYNGHEYVDLGLPSGLKWATCNVGATKPEEYGDYFAWGETSEKSTYTAGNSETYGKEISWLKSNGYIDSTGNLKMEHDAARANWGGTWRMPTMTEIEELINNSTTTWTTRNGVYGRLVTSKINGNSIFLPAAGYRVGGSLYGAGEGDYWSSTPHESHTNDAYNLGFYSGYFDWHWLNRYYGQSVRAVTE